jgi:hypothetical protein
MVYVVVESRAWLESPDGMAGVAAVLKMGETGEIGTFATVPLMEDLLHTMVMHVPGAKGLGMGSVLCRRSPQVRLPSALII